MTEAPLDALAENADEHAHVICSRPSNAAQAYSDAIKLNALNISALTSLGMLAHEAGDVTTAIERYHQALAIETTDPIATYLLQRALKDQVAEGSCQFDGLPIGLTDLDLDPFAFGDQDQVGDGMIGSSGTEHQWPNPGQNRFLQLPPFPNQGELAGIEAQREEERLAQWQRDRIDLSGDEVGSDGNSVDDEAGDEKEGSLSGSEGEASGDGEVGSDEYDEADEDNTAMSVSMNMSVSMEDDEGDGDASGSVEEESGERVGEGSTMDLE